jgi:hypothetical protein
MSRSAEWQIERTKTDNNTRQERIRHLTMPRFTARIVKIDPFKNCPVRTEGHVDIARPVYRVDHDTVYCEIDWTDEIPEDQQLQWLEAVRHERENLRGYFDRWKSLPPVVDMAGRIKLDISNCRSWSDYRQRFCAMNDQTDGNLVETIRQLVGVVSTGEVPVLLAMLHAADYSRVADELGGDDIWRRLDYTYGECAEAVGLAIMRQ